MAISFKFELIVRGGDFGGVTGGGGVGGTFGGGEGGKNVRVDMMKLLESNKRATSVTIPVNRVLIASAVSWRVSPSLFFSMIVEVICSWYVYT